MWQTSPASLQSSNYTDIQVRGRNNMKLANCAAVFVLVLVGGLFPPAQAERDEAGLTTTKRVDAKTKLTKATVKRETYGIEGKDWGVAQTTEMRTEKFHAPTPRLHALAKDFSINYLSVFPLCCLNNAREETACCYCLSAWNQTVT